VPLPLKAVIFDYGEVLSGPQRRYEVELMASLIGMETEEFQAACRRQRLAYDAGSLTPTVYWRTVKPDLSPLQIERLMELDSLSWSEPNLAVARWAARLHAEGMTTAILSNMPTPIREHVNKNCTWLPEFNVRIFSCDAGLTKPDPAIYRYCLDKLELEPGETFFLDDKEANVRSARGLGMHAVHFRGVKNLAADLQPYGNLEWGMSE
jgi:putative hydrolase of the HAD superfamily